MTRIFVPSCGPGDWRDLLADPEKHWARGYSARTLAHSWEDQDGFPPEIKALLAQHEALADVSPLMVFPEWKVPLLGGSRPSQNDAWVLAKGKNGIVSIAVEGKVEEPFDVTVGEWLTNASPGKTERMKYLLEMLGLPPEVPGTVRYQLLHRTASAVIEAGRFGATAAIMIVHSFSPQNQWFDDYAAFAKLYGLATRVGELVETKAKGGLPLYLGWAHGDERFLQA